ncbi:HAMP domain-containing protein [Paraburkholderia sp. CNPSo 3157]|uniref:HAMP domain-containing protein n=1 Tax=Paraburkholderia franconis TaxID=2654983 RepID=A0A7X1NK22_9BURK|nr:methyl-accepting chemotaxis protein [Paraburkholderia franconis]MPW22913.1 HAMP domain-containing protein [Paraburkholderia franconis]
MKIKNMKIGVRLGAGFGFTLILMAALIAVGLNRLAGISEITDKIIQLEWVKADAAQVVNARTRANARLTMQLFITSDRNKIAAITHEIDGNKAVIDGALETLDKLVSRAEGKELLAKVKETRAAYMTSFGKVAGLLATGERDRATTMMNDETLPTLDRLEQSVRDLVKLQRRVVNERGEEARQVSESARVLMLALGLSAMLIGIACAYVITRSITRPLREAVQIAQTVASGDLTSRIHVPGHDETGQLLQALGRMNDSLKKIVGEVRIGTDTIATASSQIANGNEDLSSRTEEQASSLEETVASMQELTSTVRQNADNALQANRLALSASEVATRGGAVISQVVDTMGAINESANRVVEIIGVIEGIAFQTNILALNAAVESARAGEHGRGFAVVAGEVRNLAQRSATAAREIKAMIGDSVQRVQTGSQQVAQAGATMDEIVTSIERVTDIMGEITAATQSQSAGIEQINQAMEQMDQVTQQNAALVEEAAAAAASLQDQAGHLAQLVGVFRLEGAQIHVVPKRRDMVSATTSAVHAVPKTAPPRRAMVVSAEADNLEWEQF